MIKETFWTKKELMMLNLQTHDGGMTLSVDNFPLQDPAPAESWFSDIIQLDHVRAYTDYRIRAVRILCNRIAATSRRGVGNVLFVPDHDVQVFYEHAAHNAVHFIDRYVIDRSLKSNELRAAYWKLIYKKDPEGRATSVPVAIDGSVQFFENGFSCSPNFRRYFSRCFL